jgi:hypothetical protein
MAVVRVVTSLSDDPEVKVRLPASFSRRWVEVIVTTLDVDERPVPTPHPEIAGKGRMLGDPFEGIPREDWDLP